MSTTDGTVVGTTKIVDNGLAACRFNFVLVAEGFQQNQLGQFANVAQLFVNTLFATPPFDDLRTAFNFYRVDVTSTDSGADDPAACTGGTGATAATYFDASFCNSGIQRLLLVNETTVRNVVDAEVPEWHQILVIVNSPIWGGAGGTIGTTSLSTLAPGWQMIAIHEFGHTGFGLADEYEYWAGCGLDTDRNNYTGAEPAEPNVTIDSARATNKWRDLVLATTAMPTSENANCTICDPQPNPVTGGTVGAFEGGRYFHCDIFRPEFSCMMRNFAPFCAVCRREIRKVLEPFVRPECSAPVFTKLPIWSCFVLMFVAIFVLMFLAVTEVALGGLCALSRLARGSGTEGRCRQLEAVRCQRKQIVFRVQNCARGNDDPCAAA